MVPELIPVLGSQPAGDMSHKPGVRLPLGYFPSGPQLLPQPLKGHFTHMKLFFKITEIETLINITYIVRFLRSTDVLSLIHI